MQQEWLEIAVSKMPWEGPRQCRAEQDGASREAKLHPSAVATKGCWTVSKSHGDTAEPWLGQAGQAEADVSSQVQIKIPNPV